MTNNIVLDKSGTNQITVYTTIVEEVLNKKLTNITPPTSTANKDSGPKPTKIVDLLRIEQRFTFDGKILSTDRTKLRNVFNAGGTVTLEYAGSDYEVNIEKLSIKEEPEDAGTSNPDYYLIKFTCIVGEAI